MIGCECGEYGGALYFNKAGYSLVVDNLVCSECYGSGGKGLSIYICSIAAFEWSNLCIRGSGYLVYSVVNQPAASDIDKCYSHSFTSDSPYRSRTGDSAHIFIDMYLYLYTL